MTTTLGRVLWEKLVRVEALDDGPDPHPDLVRAQRPATAEVAEAAALLGFAPDGSYLGGGVRVSLLTL